MQSLHKTSKINSKKGSFLIEVLLSIVVLSVSIVLIIQAMTSSLRAISYGTQYGNAALVLDNVLTGLISEPLLKSNSLLNVDNDNFPLDYNVAVTKQSMIENVQDGVDMKDVRIEISWKVNGKERQVTTNTYWMGRLDP